MEKFYCKLSTKLANPSTSSKTYWPILKTFVNGQKIPIIQPLPVNDNFITNFLEKANLFGEFFSKQCQPLQNNSTLPKSNTYHTENRLNDITFDNEKLLKLTQSLDANKAHGYDGISIRMLKLGSPSIIKPLSIIFQNCLESSAFPDDWKKGNIVPVHKKSSKQLVNNYRPVSLLPICSKIFEKVIFDSIFNFMIQNNLLNSCQSGFRPSDSCINQLISITHNIYRAFDANPSLEVRGVFLDLSKVFDKVWHKGLVYKLKSIGINGNALQLIESFLHSRRQRVVLNGQSSSWLSIRASVPQGSVLGPLLFLIYINDLPEGLNSEVKLFADDTSLFSIVNCVNISVSTLNTGLLKIQDWAYQWKMSFNPDRTKQVQEIIFSRKKNAITHPPLFFNNSEIKLSSNQKHLGLTLDSKLSFNEHINNKIHQAKKGVGLLRKLQTILPRNSLLTIYKSLIRPLLDYADVIYNQPFNASFSKQLESVQYNAALAITGAIKSSSREKLYQELGLEYLYQRRWARRLWLLYKVFSIGQPSYIYDLLPPMRSSRRHVNSFNTVSCKSEYFKNSFIPNVINEWNKLDPDIRSSTSYNLFRNTLLKFIRPAQRKTFNINDSVGVKLLTRLQLGFSHLREHKFRHGFRDILNPLCPCSIKTETIAHYFLRCHFYNANRSALMNELNEIDSSFIDKFIDLILYGSDKFDDKKNHNILMSTIKFIKDSRRFDKNLLQFFFL